MKLEYKFLIISLILTQIVAQNLAQNNTLQLDQEEPRDFKLRLDQGFRATKENQAASWNDLYYLIKTHFRRSRIKTSLPLKLKLNPMKIRDNYFVNTTIYLGDKDKRRFDITKGTKYTSNVTLTDGTKRKRSNLIMDSRKMVCRNSPCTYSIIIDVNGLETGITVYQKDAKGISDVLMRVGSKPALINIPINQYEIENYIAPMVSWAVGTLPKGSKPNAFCFLDETYSTLSKKDANTLLNYLRITIESNPNVVVNWFDVKIIKSGAKNNQAGASQTNILTAGAGQQTIQTGTGTATASTTTTATGQTQQTSLTQQTVSGGTQQQASAASPGQSLSNQESSQSSTTEQNTSSESQTNNTQQKITHSSGKEIDTFLDAKINPSNCPNQCSGHGLCFDNNCICQNGFSGPDCGIVAFLFKQNSNKQRFLQDSLNKLDTVNNENKDVLYKIAQQKINPCYNKGYQSEHKIIGSGDFGFCKNFINNTAISGNNNIDISKQDPIQAGPKLIAIGNLLGLEDASLQDYQDNVKNFCEMPFSEVKQKYNEFIEQNIIEEEDLGKYCHSMVYELLTLQAQKAKLHQTIRFVAEEQAPTQQKSIQWQLNAVNNSIKLGKSNERQQKTWKIVLCILALIFYISFKVHIVKVTLYKIVDPIFKKFGNEEIHEIDPTCTVAMAIDQQIQFDKDKINAIKDDEKIKENQMKQSVKEMQEEMEQERKMQYQTESFEFKKRRINYKKFQFVYLPLQISFQVLFIIGVWEMIATNYRNYFIFLILMILSFVINLSGILDIQSEQLLEMEYGECYMSNDIQDHDIQLLLKISEDDDSQDDNDENLELFLMQRTLKE